MRTGCRKSVFASYINYKEVVSMKLETENRRLVVEPVNSSSNNSAIYNYRT